jgi:hypothetical protein
MTDDIGRMGKEQEKSMGGVVGEEGVKTPLLF